MRPRSSSQTNRPSAHPGYPPPIRRHKSAPLLRKCAQLSEQEASSFTGFDWDIDEFALDGICHQLEDVPPVEFPFEVSKNLSQSIESFNLSLVGVSQFLNQFDVDFLERQSDRQILDRVLLRSANSKPVPALTRLPAGLLKRPEIASSSGSISPESIPAQREAEPFTPKEGPKLTNRLYSMGAARFSKGESDVKCPKCRQMVSGAETKTCSVCGSSLAQPPKALKQAIRNRRKMAAQTRAAQAKHGLNVFDETIPIEGLQLEQESQSRWILQRATIPSLISLLLRQQTSLDFTDMFFVTHGSFMSSTELLKLLISAYNDSITNGLILNQSKIVNLIKHWFIHSPWQFRLDDALISDIKTFTQALCNSQSNIEKALGSILEISWKAEYEKTTTESEEELRLQEALEGAPDFHITKKVASGKAQSVLDFHPLELARQIAIMNHQEFCKIPIVELLDKNFEIPAKSPSLAYFSDHYSKIIGWVGTELYRAGNPKSRAKIYSHFISIAEKLQTLQDYLGLTAICSGLTHYTVAKFYKTLKLVSDSDHKKLRHLSDFTSPLGNFRALRPIIEHTAVPPLVPVPAMFLRDLTFIEDGNKTWNPEGDTVNVAKLVMIGKIIARVLEIQKIPYRLFRVPIIVQYFEKYEPMSLEDREEKFVTAEAD